MINFYIQEAESNVAGPIEVRDVDGSLKETIRSKSPKRVYVIHCGRCDERLEGSWNHYKTSRCAAIIIGGYFERGAYPILFEGHGSECPAACQEKVA
jgi:hypothetical protein